VLIGPFPDAPPPIIMQSKIPAVVTVKVPVLVNVNIVYDKPPTVMLDDVPPLPTP
jgi:hypothetical protein